MPLRMKGNGEREPKDAGGGRLTLMVVVVLECRASKTELGIAL